jgi:hypothetical protein
MVLSMAAIRFANRSFVKTLLAVVHRLELAAVDRDRVAIEQMQSGQSATKREQTLRMAGPLSRRKSAIVLKFGARRPVSQISSRLGPHSRSSRREDWTWLRCSRPVTREVVPPAADRPPR